MARGSGELRRSLPALGVTVPVAIIFIAVLGIILTAAGPDGLRLSKAETTAWIAMLYGMPAIPSLVLSVRYRQPLMLTGNVFAIIFLGSLGDQFTFAQLAGASFLAGALVSLAGLFGVTGQLAKWIPAPIVHSLIVAAVMPFVVAIFSGLSDVDEQGNAVAARVPFMVACALVAYVLSRRFLGARLPPVFPALIAGIAAAGFTGQFGPAPSSFSVPDLAFMSPEFSLQAIISATPVLVAVISLQTNLPSIIYMRTQGFSPPERVINVVSGAGTMAASLVAPMVMSLALPLAPLTAGPSAGEHSLRYRSVYLPSLVLLLIALLAGVAADLATLVPQILLLALGGLAVVGILISSLREITKGPLLLGPVFALAVALSHIHLFSLGPFFWSLVIGTAITLILEQDEWKQLRAATEESSTN